MKPSLFSLTLLSSLAVASLDLVAADAPVARPVFRTSTNGEFTFDTGVLRGTLRAGGKSLGLTSVVHVPTGRRLDRSNGWFSHYRVFSEGVRYGAGAWDWPSAARLLDDGAVEVAWASATNRPFAMKAVYRWRGPAALDLETIVESRTDLRGFEVFLASYFDEAFTNAFALVGKPPGSGAMPALLAAQRSFGDWLMFPRDPGVVGLIQDGRWRLEPNPVKWTIMPALERPLGVRRDPKSGLTVALAARGESCFAVSMPYETEAHGSVYLSLFGHDLVAGKASRAKARLTVLELPTAADLLGDIEHQTQ